MALLEVGVAWFQTPDLKIIWAAGMAAACTLLLGIIFGFLGRAVTKRLRQTRLLRIEVEEKKRHIEHERLRTLYELTSTIIGTLNYKRVLDSALDLSVSALNPDQSNTIDERLVSAVLLFKGNQLGVGSARRFTNADMRVTLSGSEGILKKVFDEGEPVITTNVGFDPELGRIIALRSCTSAYCFPLRSGFNVYGTLLFAHSDPNYFTEDRREILDILGHQAVIAIQNARLYQDLVEEKERMIEVQEETRKKLARDLHDGPTQTISAMAMRLNLTHRMIEDNPKAASEELAKIEELAHQTTKEIRHMLFTLRPLVLESQGLVAALQAMADKMRDIYTQNVSVEVNEKLIEQLEMGKQGVMFYIVEEAINNARKYAKASNIWVRLRSIDPGLTLLEIQDNGVGFDVAAVTRAYDQRGSLGMINLQERTELINGLLNIDSAPGKGTNVQVYIPLTDEAADRLHHAK
jgi:signal transduction histidine kinase